MTRQVKDGVKVGYDGKHHSLDLRLSAVDFDGADHALVLFDLRTKSGSGVEVVATIKQRVQAYHGNDEQYDYSRIVSEAGDKLHAEFMEMAKYLKDLA